ncbi:sensor histidine kinase [Amycolatopsis cihanbeyliensis]|uniref:sensor histidine kinase n=1 Tax=Amycolatopsis cihanbeyliensis TaxID=1128664 RepID=UPI001151B974|nr:histidine kinase [Amycolatopsis cihanbeyliensis]
MDSDNTGRAAGLAPRLALVVVAVVFTGFVVNAFQYVLAQSTDLSHVLPAAAALAAMMYLQLGIFSDPHATLHGTRGYLALAAQVGLGFAPIVSYGEAWMGLLGFVAGDALLVLRPLAGWLSFAGIAVVSGAIRWDLSGLGIETGYVVNLTMVIGLVVYGLSRLRSLVAELAEARSELADLAVAGERLRFARDLHDLLGFSLSAITLKAELTHRLIVRQPERATRELAEILDISRQAHSDVRTIASSYRELSFEEELASAGSVLTAADVLVTVRGEPGDLLPRTSTVLATVLREAVTNLLRHSKAENCEITLSREGDSVSVEIVNDGVRAIADHDRDRCRDQGRDQGNGIGNLTSRVEALGGTLSAGASGDTFRLRVSLRAAGDGTAPAPAPEQRTTERGPSMVPRLGQVIAAAVFTGYAISALVFVAAASLGPLGTTVSVACVLASLALMVGFFSRPNAPVHSPLGRGALLVQALLSFLPIAVAEDPYVGLPGFAAGAALLVLPARAGLPVFLAFVAAAGGAHWLLDGDPIGIVYGFLVSINQGLVLFGLTRLMAMVRELHDTRSDLADLVVFKERLRFARDLHDLLGYSLSAITLKSELAHRLVAKDPERAQHELSGILDISRQALVDVRAVASSYRELSLDEEAASARDLLAAANIEVTVRMERCALPPNVRTTLATVLREGVTNALRHSNARCCEITLRRKGDRVVMEIVNDGVPGAEPRCTEGGSGIRNLAARVAVVGGTLRAGVTEGRHRLLAEVPGTAGSA